MIQSVVDSAKYCAEKMSLQTSAWNGRSVENLGYDGVLAGSRGVERVSVALAIIIGGAFFVTLGIADIMHSYEFVCTYGATFVGAAALLSLPALLFAALYG